MTELLVYVDRGAPALCGRLATRATGAGRAGASFEYDAGWLERADRFALDPELPLGRGRFDTRAALFRCFTDPAPDRWGQTLLRRGERMAAEREGRAPVALGPVDFLVRVDDEPRLGALRFKTTEGGPFLAAHGDEQGIPRQRVPPLVALAKLLGATARVVDDKPTEADLALVLAPGTSLGGARPKASVRDPEGNLLVAKFPRKDDDHPVTRWEATMLALAVAAGIDVAPFRIAMIAKKPVLLGERFDRVEKRRVPFVSAMTALGAEDAETHSYLELAEAIRREGSRPTADLRELFRRVLFNILTSNTDDHLRNHGFLHDGAGWRLAPAYDLNPVPRHVRPRIHALAIDDVDPSGGVEVAFSVAPAFGVSDGDARQIAREVATAVKTWATAAKKLGITAKQLGFMESAFDARELALALRGG